MSTALNPLASAALITALDEYRVITDHATREIYSHDETPKQCLPLAVVFPHNHDEVVAIVRIAIAFGIVLIARGAGSGNVGGALPSALSVVVSFECMNQILEFHPEDRYIIVQAGVVTAEIDRIAREHGLFYPPDPGSAAYSRIGGNLAMNAAGPRAVKYGVTRDYTMGLRAVTGAGISITSGCRTTKGVMGYDLTRLLVGSEGTLALITEATLKLQPLPEAKATLRVCYATNADACQAVSRVMNQSVIPCALEFMDNFSIRAIQATGSANDLAAGTQALLMVEADGARDDLPRQLLALQTALTGAGLLDLQIATDTTAVAALWVARKALSHAVKSIAPLKINEDVVVPVSRLAELIIHIEYLADTYQLPIVSFGHAGNGNLHVNIMVDPADANQMQRAKYALHELFRQVLTLGGTLTGEHGVGSEKRPYVTLEIDPDSLALMRQIKHQFDPHNLLNPEKLLP